MAAEFHCEHCSKLIKAPEGRGGRRGKCPFCGSATYIPASTEDEGELGLVPLDPDEERRRHEAMQEATAAYSRLLQERPKPGDKAGREGSPKARQRSSDREAALTEKDAARLVVGYIEAMSAGRLDEAEKLTTRLARDKSQARAVLDGMAGEDLASYGLPALPRPVLLGFLRELQTRLRG